MFVSLCICLFLVVFQPATRRPTRPATLQADLIGQAKETGKDGKMRRLLHQQWLQQQDDKELQQVGGQGRAWGGSGAVLCRRADCCASSTCCSVSKFQWHEHLAWPLHRR